MDSISELLEEAVADGIATGIVAGITTADEIRFLGCAGYADQSARRRMATDTIFWIASMTKPITTAAALAVVDHGLISLDEPLDRYIPDLAALPVLRTQEGYQMTVPLEGDITLRRLLNHTAGFGFDFMNADLARYSASNGIPSIRSGKLDAFRSPLLFQPGEGWEYGIGVDWAGRVIEKATSESLDALVAQYVSSPLAMRDTTFRPSEEQLGRLAVLSQRTSDGTLVPIRAKPRTEPEFLGGGGGLRSTVPDYLKFIRMILGKGVVDGVQVLGESIVDAMTSNQIGESFAGDLDSADEDVCRPIKLDTTGKAKFGFGFLISQERSRSGCAAGTLSWAGLPNCFFWIDSSAGIGAVIMMQHLPFADTRSVAFLRRFERVVYEELEASTNSESFERAEITEGHRAT